MVDHGANSPPRNAQTGVPHRIAAGGGASGGRSASGESPSEGEDQRDGTSDPKVAKVSSLLKAFVIAGGVVLLIGVVLLAVLIMLQVSGQNDQAREEGPAAPVDLALPSGARITQVVADGRRLVLLAEDADGRQYLAVVDAASGERQSLIRITPADAADIK